MRRRGIYGLVALVIALSLAMAGCSMLAKKASENAIESATGGQVKVNQNNGGVTVKTDQGTYQAGSTYEWPSTMPSDVPKFSYGKITSVIQSNTATGKGISVGIENAAPDAFDKYKNDLQNAGWTIETTSQSTSGLLISASKDKRTVMASFSSSSDKGLSGAVIYSEGQ
ncbi:MAG: hypothetical protein ABSC17_08310 [Thermacetogeniaceae bacterium]